MTTVQNLSKPGGAPFDVDKSFAEAFEDQGYCVIRGFLSSEEAAGLIEEIKNAETIDGVSGLNKGTLTFYSGVYYCSKKLQAFVSQPKVVNFLKQIIGPNFWVRWDQAVAKGPGSGTFPWHQDNAYNNLKDGHYQLWVALTATTRDNGGLWVVPGSHKHPLPHKQIDNHMVCQEGITGPVFIDAEPGDIILFSSYLLHSTTPNITQATRWAYVIEYMSCDHFDPGIRAPYFVVSQGGEPTAEFVRFYKGNLNPLNHMKYWRWQLSKLMSGRKS
ncbi:MAG: phytanoyl-CoA dioxygenase family protein [Cyanobacteria bacterium J06649_5]